VWLYILTLYSVALLAFGVGMKAMLTSVVCIGDDDSHRLLASTSYSSYGSSTYGSVDSSDTDNPYCDSVPNNYSRLLIETFVAQYACQQLSLLLHGGVRTSMANLYTFSQKSAVMIVGTKVSSILFGLYLSRYPGNLQAYELLGIVCLLTIVQGLIQAYENMIKNIIHHEVAPTTNLLGRGESKDSSIRDHHGSLDRPPSPKISGKEATTFHVPSSIGRQFSEALAEATTSTERSDSGDSTEMTEIWF
jgi:hypothetical protein